MIQGLPYATSNLLLLSLWAERLSISKLSELSRSIGKHCGGESAVEGMESPPQSISPSEYPDTQHLNSVIINLNNDNRPHAIIQVLGKELTALLDSGANCSLLAGRHVDIVNELGLRKGLVEGGIKTADGTQHKIRNYAHLPIVYNNRNLTLPVLLTPTIPDCIILGMNFWEKFGVKAVCCSLEMTAEITPTQEQLRQLTPEEHGRLERVVEKFPKATAGTLGRTSLYEHRIDVGDAKPKSSDTIQCPSTCWKK